MMTYLDKSYSGRKELNIIENKLDEICEKTELSKEVIREDIQRFNDVSKLNMKCKDSSSKPCSVVQRSRAFLYGENFPSVDDYCQLCNHAMSQDDKIMIYMKSYQIFQTYNKNLAKCKTDKKAMNIVFGKIMKNAFN